MADKKIQPTKPAVVTPPAKPAADKVETRKTTVKARRKVNSFRGG